MSQISPPIRILLAVAALFLVAWMTVLKPKSVDVAAPTPTTTGNVATGKPAVSAPGKLAEKAKSAVEDASRKHETTIEGETAEPASEAGATGAAAGTATGTSGSGAATPAATAAKGELKGLPAPVVKAIGKQQVMVIGFFNADGADDRAVRTALSKVDRWNGRVFVKAAPIGKVGRWSRIAKGVDVEQSPTVVVVGRNLEATPLVGFVDTRTIDQAVVDSMRAAGGLFTSAYLRQVNKACAGASSALFASPDARSISEAPKRLSREAAILASFAGDVRGIKAPARFKAFKAATVADIAAMRGVWTGLAKSIRANPRPAAVLGSVVSAQGKLAPINKRFDTRMAKHHVVSCVNG